MLELGTVNVGIGEKRVWLPKESMADSPPLPVTDRTRAEIDRYSALRFCEGDQGISHQIPRIALRELAGLRPKGSS
jgi:hypothetical protein